MVAKDPGTYGIRKYSAIRRPEIEPDPPPRECFQMITLVMMPLGKISSGLNCRWAMPCW